MASETGESVFDVTSDSEMTQSERWRQSIDRSVLAPLRIMWSDNRTRVGLAVTMLYVFAGTAGIYLVPSPEFMNGPTILPPFENMQFPLGTDKFGQGIFRMLVHATPSMLQMIFSGAIFTVIVATIVGTVAGFVGGLTDRVLMTVNDIAMTIPGLPLVIVLAIALNPKNPLFIGILLSINAWAGLARNIRAEVLSVRENSYVEASQAMGVSIPKIIQSDILPNLMPYITVNFMQAARNVVFASVGLYFLGLLPFTTLNWGVMMNMARQAGALRSATAFHWLAFPMLTITFLTFGLILLAQGMDRVFNPRVRARHADTVDAEGAMQSQ